MSTGLNNLKSPYSSLKPFPFNLTRILIAYLFCPAFFQYTSVISSGLMSFKLFSENSSFSSLGTEEIIKFILLLLASKILMVLSKYGIRSILFMPKFQKIINSLLLKILLMYSCKQYLAYIRRLAWCRESF